jgi:diacylglycerol O-acyltransferase
LIPVSLQRPRRPGCQAPGNHLSGYLLELPTAEPDPIERLCQVRDAMARNKTAGPRRGPCALALLAGWLPTAVHRTATPIVTHAAPLLFDTVITSVPWPDLPLRLDGAELHEVYPLAPLGPHQALGVATATYRDSVHIGLLTDPRRIPEPARLRDTITESATELTAALR